MLPTLKSILKMRTSHDMSRDVTMLLQVCKHFRLASYDGDTIFIALSVAGGG